MLVDLEGPFSGCSVDLPPVRYGARAGDPGDGSMGLLFSAGG